MKKFTYLKGFLSLFLLAFLTANKISAKTTVSVSATPNSIAVSGLPANVTLTGTVNNGRQLITPTSWSTTVSGPANSISVGSTTLGSGNNNSAIAIAAIPGGTPVGTYTFTFNYSRTSGGGGTVTGTLTTTVTIVQPTVIINPPALSISTILTGGTLNLTATRNTDAAWTGGNGNFTYTWSATGPGSVSFTNNPVTITGTSSSTVASGFSVAGTYTITCTVQETGGISVTSSSKTVNVLASAPTAANLWATSSDGTQISSFVVSNGTYFAGPTNIFAPTFGGLNGGSSTAALGKSDQPTPATGYFYYLPNTSSNSGVIDIYGATSNGSTIAVVGTIDINGASTNSLGFVRLGMGPDGTGWILAGDGSTVYLAKFIPNGTSAATVSIVDADGVSLVGGAASTFQNGDLCVSGGGKIFALANDGSGVTQIFTGDPNGNSTTFTKKWDLIDNTGAAFTGRVNGVAFDVLGSIYISTDNGLYFIDQNTVNGPAGTVGCFLVRAVTGLQDLASNVFPSQTTLPVKLTAFSVTKQGNNAILDWTTASEINASRFEIERSYDGVNFSSIGTKQAVGNSASDVNYLYSDPISISSGIIYYRIKSVDIDARSSFSKVVALRINGKAVSGLTVYPNPFTTDLKVELNADKEVSAVLRVSNAAGQVVVNKNAQIMKGNNVIVLSSELSALNRGMYIVELITEEGRLTQKIIKR